MPAERLQKVLAAAGIASRRGAEELIGAGRVTVNGAVAGLGDRADLAIDRVALDGSPIGGAETTVHFAVHKPRGLLSSARAERGRDPVTSLVPSSAFDGRLWPAGRLDADSEGLMILTNDGAWAEPRPPPSVRDRTRVRGPAGRLPSPRRSRPCSAASSSTRDPPACCPPVEPRRRPKWRAIRENGARGAGARREGRKREVRRSSPPSATGAAAARTGIGPLSCAGCARGDGERSARPRSRARRPCDGTARLPRSRHLAIAIDGPSGSGKSTIGHGVAQRIGATFVDTGLMYRAPPCRARRWRGPRRFERARRPRAARPHHGPPAARRSAG